ncbi:MAG: ribonuclease Y [Patescibacteria group bacterium]|nr:ribonuclease Y [Patescibacteria group bacterium]MDD5121087.1 ribonuclease Y [Patescibacteria group bacterium]MDD5221983.1 ribonuclease Y [Patescibacteria group bacterium]MDD5395994.1 ribonuclease Y [Patescibacteria group bacterium]
MIYTAYLLIALVVGVVIGYVARKVIAQKRTASAEAKAEELIRNAKTKQQELFFKAREEALKIIEEAKKEEQSHRQELKSAEERFERRQSMFDKKLLELEENQKELTDRAARLEEAKVKIKKIYEDAKVKLEEISGYSKEQAQQVLFEQIEKDNQDIVLERIKKLEKFGSDQIDKKAKQMLSTAMERLASSVSTERTTSSVNLPSDDMKGRIIGREGRNIKVIEQLTGVEIVVDDTPEVIFASSFNPIRRQLAKRTLEKLIADGRIQPARIEKYVEEAKTELIQEIKSAGEDAVYQLGIAGLDPKLVQLLGRLKYRTSYGQNVLQHSIETANLAAILASDLGVNVAMAKKAGLLHDIGKAIDHETEGTHPEIGRDLAKKYNLPEEIITAIGTHHEDHPPIIEAVIVKVADALSGARPGARRDSYEDYIKRLDDLEQVAKTFKGVDKVYAIQAGREIRVFVLPQEVDDLAAAKLARAVADKIEADLKYPGEIKVTVIRESKVVEFAR